MKKLTFMLLTLIVVACRVDNPEDKNLHELSEASIAELDTSLIATSAELFYNNQAYEYAFSEYERLIAKDSTNGKYQYRAGVCKARLRRPEHAVQHFITSAKLNYRVRDSFETLGMTYYILLQDDSLALIYFQRAQEIQFDSDIEKFIEKIKSKLTNRNSNI